jgi:deoxycytidylate deaminase
MRQVPGWDAYYLDICKVVAARSKDPNTQIGCVIAGPAHA